MLLTTAFLLVAPQALGATASPAWTITSVSEPTNFSPGESSGHAHYLVSATNSGGAATDGTQITLTDSLPAGITVDSTVAITGQADGGGPVTCSVGPPIKCTDANPLQSGQSIYLTVPVDVAINAPRRVTNEVVVSGGGAASASASEPTTISPTSASAGVQSFDGSVTSIDGSPDTQAGSHPYEATVSFHLDTTLAASSTGFAAQGAPIPVGDPKDIQVALPPGLLGDPSAAPKCTHAQLLSGFLSTCPVSAQVGVVTVEDSNSRFHEAVYNVVPPPGMPAQFGFRYQTTAVFIDVSVRTGGDYGVTTTLRNLPQEEPILSSSLTLWGVPGDPSHNAQRCSDFGLIVNARCLSPNPFQATVSPFLTLPTACLGPQTTTLSTDSWQDPGVFKSASFLSHDNQGTPVGASGCERLGFTPSITVQPDTTVADSPTGLAVDLHLPQDGLSNPTGLAQANLKTAVVTLPAGVSVNPSAANGLVACSPAQIGIDNANQPTCPDASKIGSVEVDTPLLPDPLTGGVYVAQQNQNPFGSLLAIYVSAQSDGVLVKLAGHVVANPVTGKLETTFDNNPQLPFTNFKLDFVGGARAVLATPGGCGTYATMAALTPWNGRAAAISNDPFTIDSGCISGFNPSFTAGTQNAQAGSFSPFVLSFERSDSDQNFSGLSVKLPPGMLAKLAGVQQCSDAQLAAAAAKTGAQEQVSPSCPVGSHVGTVTTSAGAGLDPFFLQGKVYLTGPYKGAPFGLAVVVPAVAGPYDLGTVVVRQALEIDPSTAQVTAVSDPFPTILQGIPLRIRRIDVSLNRGNFTLNPTSCDPMSVTGTLSSTGGLSGGVSSRFQVGGCSSLGFSPKLKIALSGKGKTRSGDHPTLSATLTDPSGQANIRSARVALPLSLALDPNNSKNVCPFATGQAVHGGAVGCPASTVVGTASVVTPLLSQPLTGKVYLVQGIRFGAGGRPIRTLPSLLVPLRGQIALDLRAQSFVSGGKLVTTFSTIPDAPVSRFTLQINGGPKGLLVITGRGLSICQKAQVGNASFGAQAGKTSTGNVTLGTPCGKPAHLRVLSRQVKAGALILRVRTSERGRVTVTGRRVRRFSRVLSAGVHRIRIAIKRGSRSSRAVKVKVQVAPANARPAATTFTVRM